ncbi:hypothetical protein FOA52_010120 [Chlamydomonas sp. UWO 241]|nr:hypothetical protein FOA52_010120 [Chlamydomonas sp. UWO 241]
MLAARGMQSLRASPSSGAAVAPRLKTNVSQRQGVACRQAASAGALGMLQPASTKPIDRIRYQAKLVFDTLDTDGDGKLSPEQLQGYFSYSNERLGAHSPLAERYTVEAARAAAEGATGFEDFVQLVRDQLRCVDRNRNWVQTQLPPKDMSRLLHASALSIQEMGVILATFRLLDSDNNGLVPLDFLRKAQGIEKKVFEGVLEDADDDEDGCLRFEDFLTSYHRERPVFMSMAVLFAHSAAFYGIFQLPVDVFVKVIIAAILVMKPFLITGPVVKIWRIGQALVGRFMATREMAAKGTSFSNLY